MKKKILHLFFTAIFLFMFLAVGCSDESATSSDSDSETSQNQDASGEVTLLITKNFGSETLLEKQVSLEKNWTVMDVLKANAEVATKWDGDFVNGINGFESDTGGLSGKRMDWFYFINGVCADICASSYELSSSEKIWWDYHEWNNMGMANSAVIGFFPEPFVHGYRGIVNKTAILCSNTNRELADKIKEILLAGGVSSVEVKNLDNKFVENRENPTIVLGEWKELKGIKYLDKFNNAYKKTGTNIHFTESSFELLGKSGDATKKINKEAGAVVSAGEGLGDENVLWIITGSDKEGLNKAVDVLVNNPEKINKNYGIAVDSGEVISLPVR